MSKAILFYALTVYGCVLMPKRNTVDVHVSAFNTTALDKAKPICFKSGPKLNKNISGIQYESVSQDILEACTTAARMKGMTITNDEKQCVTAYIYWDISDPKTLDMGTSTKCSNAFGNTICQSFNNQADVYAKMLSIHFVEGPDNKTMHEVNALLSSTDQTFYITTDIALCRAALTGYPRKMWNNVFETRTDFDDEENFPAH